MTRHGGHQMNDYKRGEERIWRISDVDGHRVSCREVGELVRCKDCSHGTLTSLRGVLVVECAVIRMYKNPDGYCDRGERKDDEWVLPVPGDIVA